MQKTQLEWEELKDIYYALYSNRLAVVDMMKNAKARGEKTKGMENTIDKLSKLQDKVCKMMTEANEENLRELGLGK